MKDGRTDSRPTPAAEAAEAAASTDAAAPDAAPAPVHAPVPDTAPALAPDARGLARIWRDARRVALVTGLACLGLAGFEFIATLVAAPTEDIGVLASVRMAALSVALLAVLWLALVLLLVPLGAAARGFLALVAPVRARSWRGIFGAPPEDAIAPGAPWLWALLFAALGYIATSAYLTFRAITWFKEPQLTALLLAVLQLPMIALFAGFAALARPLLRGLGERLHRRARRVESPAWRALWVWLNPLGRVGAAVISLVLVSLPAIWLTTLALPQLAAKVPWRHLVALLVWLVASHLAALWLSRRPRRKARAPASPKALAKPLAAGVGGALFVVVTLTVIGADHEAKSVATAGSPVLATLIDGLRRGTDIDGDGFGVLLGENDCAPFDGAIHPLARDIPDNGIDENCNGRDFSFRTPVAQAGATRRDVPDAFLRDWNVLLITIDTVRYDHTSFGGYIETSGRDTTPNLADLVERSVSFDFTQAPSAGTMASIPAILTSKFFHSGIALDEDVKPRTPPRLKPKNLLISEIFKANGYQTGALLTHPYFNDWGMEQGFDTYDNELGKDHNPAIVAAPELTDKAVAWIARQHDQKWFLWTHYIDPHGYYVDHPGEINYGSEEKDRYNGELFFTDKHLGRLFKAIGNMPIADRTIIIVTSDHGDAFGEHGFINHGQALYRELLHIPMIIYVPGLPPRRITGATTPLDIVPTVSDLIGHDYEPAQFEGKSLVPELFYGEDNVDRVVFAETDWPKPQRAAISKDYKLIVKLQRNLYEFFDLNEDPWEKSNIANRGQRDEFERMKRILEDWLERVFFARDAASNQQIGKQFSKALLPEKPAPRNPVNNVRFDDGRIEVIGYDTDRDAYSPGDTARVSVYMYIDGERPSANYEMQMEGWIPPTSVPDEAAARTANANTGGDATLIQQPLRVARSRRRLTLGGVFSSIRWRPGEYVVDNFLIRLPRRFTDGDRLAFGLGMKADKGDWDSPAGPTRLDAPHIAVLGQAPLIAPPKDEGKADGAKPKPKAPKPIGDEAAGRGQDSDSDPE